MMLSNPKKIFLLDGFGALLSAFLLGFILVKFELVFGIPKATLYFLTIIPVAFFIYDAYYFLKKDTNISKGLKRISILNILYCVLSILCALYHIDQLTFWGWSYIIIEVIIVFILALFEFKLAKKLIRNI